MGTINKGLLQIDPRQLDFQQHQRLIEEEYRRAMEQAKMGPMWGASIITNTTSGASNTFTQNILEYEAWVEKNRYGSLQARPAPKATQVPRVVTNQQWLDKRVADVCERGRL